MRPWRRSSRAISPARTGPAVPRGPRRWTSSSGAADFGCPVASHLTCVGSNGRRAAAYLTRGRATRRDEHRRPPRRSAAGANRFQPLTAGGLRYANELVALIRASSRNSASRWPAIRKRTRKPEPGDRPAEPEAQGSGRRRRGDHAVVLRQRRFLPLPRRLRKTRHSCARSFRAFCQSRTCADPPHHGALRGPAAVAICRSARSARGQRRGPIRGRCGLCHCASQS